MTELHKEFKKILRKVERAGDKVEKAYQDFTKAAAHCREIIEEVKKLGKDEKDKTED